MTLDILAIMLLLLGVLTGLLLVILVGLVSAVLGIRLHVSRRRHDRQPRLAH